MRHDTLALSESNTDLCQFIFRCGNQPTSISDSSGKKILKVSCVPWELLLTIVSNSKPSICCLHANSSRRKVSKTMNGLQRCKQQLGILEVSSNSVQGKAARQSNLLRDSFNIKLSGTLPYDDISTHHHLSRVYLFSCPFCSPKSFIIKNL